MPELTAESVQQAIDAILKVLGDPTSGLHAEALKAFKEGDEKKIRYLAAVNLADNYCKSLGYLISAPKLLPTTPVILAEAARSAADFTKERTLAELGQAIEGALSQNAVVAGVGA